MKAAPLFATRPHSPKPKSALFRNGALLRSATGFNVALAGFYLLRPKATEAKKAVTAPKIGFSFSVVTSYLSTGSRQRTGPFSGEGGGAGQGGGGNTRGRLPVSPFTAVTPNYPHRFVLPFEDLTPRRVRKVRTSPPP